MITVKINDYNYSDYSKYYFRLNIDIQDFYIKMSDNYNNLKQLVLYEACDYGICCRGDYYCNNKKKFLTRFNNPVMKNRDEMNLYTKKEITDGIIIDDKLFSDYDFEEHLTEITKDNFIKLCFYDRPKKNTIKLYLKDEDFVERLSKDEIMIQQYSGKYVKTVHINKKGEEYIKTGNMPYKSTRIYLKENQRYIIDTAKNILKEHEEAFKKLGE